MTIERIARPIEVDIFWQRHRQIGFRYRNDAAGFAVNDGNWATPVALARNAPVAQAEIDLPRSDRAIAAGGPFKQARDLLPRLHAGHAVEEAGLDHASLSLVGRISDHER